MNTKHNALNTAVPAALMSSVSDTDFDVSSVSDTAPAVQRGVSPPPPWDTFSTKNSTTPLHQTCTSIGVWHRTRTSFTTSICLVTLVM
jgi:hypothetical protein